MSIRISSKEQEELILKNQKLVYYLVNKLVGVAPSDYEDIVSIGTIGLIKAAATFDKSKNKAFSTYASRCINNEIFVHYRKAKQYVNDISIDEPIGDNGRGNELTLKDTITDPESNFVEKIEDKEEWIKLINIVLNYLRGRDRIVMLYLIGNVYQREIGKKLNISQSYASRIESKAIHKIQEVLNRQVQYKEVFSMDIIGDAYRISFSSKDIRSFNKIFATLLQNLTSAEDLPDFRVSCNKERIIVQIPAHPESFAFIAKIIQEIDDYSMTFASDKSILPTDNTVSQKVETDNTDESDDATGTETVKTVEGAGTGETTRHTSQSSKISKFILTLDKFSVKQVKSQFPDVSVATVNSVIQQAKNKGLITSIARGEYAVNKT